MKRAPLQRKAALRASSALRRRRKPATVETGRDEFKRVQQGSCAVCGAEGLVRRHHVIPEQKVRREKGDPWDLRNSMWIGVERGVTCHCHANHHAASHRIPLGKVPDAALVFAVELLGVYGIDLLCELYVNDNDPRLVALEEAAAFPFASGQVLEWRP